MIISDKYKYLFIETPHTGSTAISKELIENYDGKKILPNKHANYHEFLKIATKRQKTYFVFAGVRNPLDEAISLFNKFLTDHKSNYTDPNKLLKNGGWVTQRKIDVYNFVQQTKDFDKFFKKNYRYIYTNNININKKHCNFIMRFEYLEKDFSEVLRRLSIRQTRSLPKINKTKKKGSLRSYYKKNETINYAVKIFEPFMEEWGYELPKEWSSAKIMRQNKLVYRIGKIGRYVYSIYIKAGPLKRITRFRNTLE